MSHWNADPRYLPSGELIEPAYDPAPMRSTHEQLRELLTRLDRHIADELRAAALGHEIGVGWIADGCFHRAATLRARRIAAIRATRARIDRQGHTL